MKRNEINGMSKPFSYAKHSFLSRIFKILDTDNSAKGVMIAVSLPEQNGFLYFNIAFQIFLGDYTDKLLGQSWQFWFENICPQEVRIVKGRVKNFFSAPFDRNDLILKYHIYDGAKNLIYLRHEIALHKLENCTMAVNYFYDISEKERIENCLHIKNGYNLADEGNGMQSISNREKEVLALVAEGHSSKQIADILFISNHTAISHRKHLIEKFRVKNTAQLIKKASKIMEL
ncbi:helix-turn-helix transcriptional regulator [Cellulophaga baltica]|uniref:response regulator transcription factor n=1 Tax=Cellulophaga baltica TaxID=76594 RepID=UPI002147B552|nr:helix-turn-helix transcriptional regulator [Cellulophaga baltica]MCR1024511.1 helix-turn-helix transcriptional regulator [Cellulophaga baltica]